MQQPKYQVFLSTALYLCHLPCRWKHFESSKRRSILKFCFDNFKKCLTCEKFDGGLSSKSKLCYIYVSFGKLKKLNNAPFVTLSFDNHLASVSHFDHIKGTFSVIFLTLPVAIPDEEKKLIWIFIFTLPCGASKGFIKKSSMIWKMAAALPNHNENDRIKR